jgi:hypothetical protein
LSNLRDGIKILFFIIKSSNLHLIKKIFIVFAKKTQRIIFLKKICYNFQPMKNLLKKSYKWYKKFSKKKVKGMSSVEMIFFVLGCFLLGLFSAEILVLVNGIRKQFKTIIVEQKKKIKSNLH